MSNKLQTTPDQEQSAVATLEPAGEESPNRTKPGRSKHVVQRETFETSRGMEFCSEKELTRQIGYGPEDNLRENGATEEEIDFLCGYGVSGHRVELNAFMSSQLIKWLEDKLDEHGITKVIPGDDTLEDAYRRCHTIVRVNQRINTIVEEETVVAQHAPIPDDLRQDVIDRLDADPTMPWDEALAEIVTGQLEKENNQS